MSETVSGESIIVGTDYEGVRVSVIARLGSARIPFHVDIGFGDLIYPAATSVELPALLNFPPPVLQGYSRESVTAEYAGVYYSDEWGTVYEIVRESEEFLIRHRRLADRPLQEVEADRLAGGMGLLTFARDARGRVSGIVFEESEDLPGRKIEFSKCDLGIH